MIQECGHLFSPRGDNDSLESLTPPDLMEGKSISEGGIVAAREIGYVTLTLSFEREGNKWVGTCLELGTSTFTRTLKQTQIDLKAL